MQESDDALNEDILEYIILTEQGTLVLSRKDALDDLIIVEILSKGLLPNCVLTLAQLTKLSVSTILNIASLSPSTFYRKTKNKKRLSITDSEKVYRLARMINSAMHLFEGDKQAAVEWLLHSTLEQGKCDVKVIVSTEVGVQALLNKVEAIERGVII